MLKQLSGMDSMFLYAEKHRSPLEVGALQIYDPSTAPNHSRGPIIVIGSASVWP